MFSWLGSKIGKSYYLGCKWFFLLDIVSILFYEVGEI